MNNPFFKRDDRAVPQTPSAQSPTFDHHNRTPAVAIRETQEALLLAVDLPGVKVDQLHLSVNDGVLSLHAPVATSNRDGFQPLHREYEEAAFRRAFTLPADVDAGAISARARHGVVTITLPKSRAAQPRRIAVSAG